MRRICIWILAVVDAEGGLERGSRGGGGGQKDGFNFVSVLLACHLSKNGSEVKLTIFELKLSIGMCYTKDSSSEI